MLYNAVKYARFYGSCGSLRVVWGGSGIAGEDASRGCGVAGVGCRTGEAGDLLPRGDLSAPRGGKPATRQAAIRPAQKSFTVE